MPPKGSHRHARKIAVLRSLLATPFALRAVIAPGTRARNLLVLVAIVVVALPLLAVAGGASVTLQVNIPADTVVRGEPGSTHQVALVAVQPDFVGRTCSIAAAAANNSSVHPDTVLVVSSGAAQVKLLEVEASPGKITTGDGSLALGSTITVAVTLGPDQVSSFGGTLTVSCSDEPPPTTTPPPPTTTTPPPPTSTPPALETQDVTPALAVSELPVPPVVELEPATAG
jgi:hypothetical protein